MKQIRYFSMFGLMISLFTQSCAPVFSDLQSARTAGKNNVEITPSGTTLGFNDANGSTEMQKHIGVQVAYGITNAIDFRLRYERISLSNVISYPGVTYDKTFNVIGFGPKIGLVKNRVAFYLPFGRALGSDYSKSWETQPTLLVTLPLVSNKVEVTLAPKFIKELSTSSSPLYAFNLGIAFSSDLSTWAIRPEYGRLYSSDNSSNGYYSHLSIGFTYIIKSSKNVDQLKPAKMIK